MKNTDRYTAKDIEALFGEVDGNKIIKVSRIQDYVIKGYVIPEDDSRGPGTTRYFSPRNIVEIILVNELFIRNVHRNQVKLVMDHLRNQYQSIDTGRLLNPKTPPPLGEKLIFTLHFKENNLFDHATLNGPIDRMTMPDHRVMVSIDIAKLTREIGKKCFGYRYL